MKISNSLNWILYEFSPNVCVLKTDGPVGGIIGLISLRTGETKVGLSEIRESRPDASRDIKSNTGRLGCT